mmetsp:Transcript_18334/g.51095  ORF Transcript_18334/g.51095 Transcript_18334/m.51095 type:complete len:201 (-) Transcript_18334:145-747(-)
MVQENDTELPPVVDVEAGDDNPKQKRGVIDKMCDPCGLVPDNLDQAFAHKQKMKAMKAQEEEEAAAKVAETPEDENLAAADEAVDSVLSNFTCCAKPSLSEAEEKEEVKKFPDPEEPIANNSQQSLVDFAAKMDDIDLESAAANTEGEEISEADGTRSFVKFDNADQWYKQPLYAGLIGLSGVFAIAIFVLAILIIVNKK